MPDEDRDQSVTSWPESTTQEEWPGYIPIEGFSSTEMNHNWNCLAIWISGLSGTTKQKSTVKHEDVSAVGKDNLDGVNGVFTEIPNNSVDERCTYILIFLIDFLQQDNDHQHTTKSTET